MARPTKQGIDYFPYDVDLDQDDKLQMIIGEFGIKGEIIFTKLLAWIYKNNGYFVHWNEAEQLKFAKRVSYIGGAPVNLINEVVARCVKWGLFDETVFNSFSILTSVRIQKTWTDATRKRIERVLERDIWLLSDSEDAKNSFGRKKAEETPKKAVKTPQSKVKESKVNESTGLGDKKSPSTTKIDKEAALNKRTYDWGLSLAEYVPKYGKEMIRDFFNHWSEPNKSRTKMKWEMQDTWDIEKRLQRWQRNDDKWNNKKPLQSDVSGETSAATKELLKKIEDGGKH